MKRLILAFCALVLLAGCGQMVEVKQDWDDNADFAVYKTFSWVPSEPEVSEGAEDEPAGQNKLDIDTPMREAIEKQLTAKGLVKDDENPDMLVAYRLGTRQTTYTRNWAVRYWDKTGWYQQETLTDGTLAVDLVDAKTGRMVWRGLAWGAVNKDPNQEILTRNINHAEEKVIDQYPPGSTTQQES